MITAPKNIISGKNKPVFCIDKWLHFNVSMYPVLQKRILILAVGIIGTFSAHDLWQVMALPVSETDIEDKPYVRRSKIIKQRMME